MWRERIRGHVEKLLALEPSSYKEEMWEALQTKDPLQEKKRDYPNVDFNNIFLFQDFSIASFQKLEKKDVTPFLLDNSFFHLVFVNGFLDKKLSSIPNTIQTLDNFTIDNPFSSLWQTSKKEEKKNFFSLMNAACFSKAEAIHILDNTTLSKPLHILHILTEDGKAVFPKIYLIVGKNVKGQMIFSTASKAKKPLFHQSMDLFVDQHTKVDLYALTMPYEGEFLDSFRLFLKKEAQVNLKKISLAKKFCLFDAKILLEEKGAEFSVEAFSLLEKKSEDHSRLSLEHLAPFTKATERWKKLLLQKSLSSFFGDIVIHPEAQKSISSQYNPNLLLEDPATAYTKPELKIFADDVKASHGATVFQVQKEPLFYLRSRGLDYEQAFSLLLEGYYKEIIDQVAIDSVKKEIETQIKKLLL